MVTEAEQPAGGGQSLDPALQEHIAQAVRPILGELEQRIVQTVRQQMEQAQLEGLQGGEQQQGEEAALQGPATSPTQTVQWLGKTLSVSLQAVQALLQAMVSLLRTAMLVLKDTLTVALRLMMQVLAAVVQQLMESLRQVLASVVQQLGEVLRPLLLEAVRQLVQPLLQGVAERGVAAVLKTLESSLQARPQAQPAPTGAQEAAASAAR
jgi:hypothetical protein